MGNCGLSWTRPRPNSIGLPSCGDKRSSATILSCNVCTVTSIRKRSTFFFVTSFAMMMITYLGFGLNLGMDLRKVRPLHPALAIHATCNGLWFALLVIQSGLIQQAKPQNPQSTWLCQYPPGTYYLRHWPIRGELLFDEIPCGREAPFAFRVLRAVD